MAQCFTGGCYLNIRRLCKGSYAREAMQGKRCNTTQTVTVMTSNAHVRTGVGCQAGSANCCLPLLYIITVSMSVKTFLSSSQQNFSYSISIVLFVMRPPLTVAFVLIVLNSVVGEEQCHCFPGDACWPSEDDLASFNVSVGGTLIHTVPIASVCHDTEYNESACAAIQAAWSDPALQ